MHVFNRRNVIMMESILNMLNSTLHCRVSHAVRFLVSWMGFPLDTQKILAESLSGDLTLSTVFPISLREAASN